MPASPTGDSVFVRLQRWITAYEWVIGSKPLAVMVRPEEYDELLGAIVRRHGPEPVINPCFMGVPIKIDGGPYPWGTFPAHE